MPKTKKTKIKKIKKEKKAVEKKPLVEGTPKSKPAKSEKYFEEVGRRKTAIARVRLKKGGKDFLINGKPLAEYFTTRELQGNVLAPLILTGYLDKFSISVKVKGGGITSQADAIRHGISRNLVLLDKDLRKKLKKAGYLKRDSRMRERKKFGLKRARRAPQWRKR